MSEKTLGGTRVHGVSAEETLIILGSLWGPSVKKSMEGSALRAVCNGKALPLSSLTSLP